MTGRIGIPCGLFYHKYKRLWHSFFDTLGVETVLSGNTNHRIHDLGLRNCINEACLPLKVYFGHVMALKDEVDALFIPRFTSIQPREYICPKFGGLPDMVRGSLTGLPKIIDIEINRRKKNNEKQVIYEIASELGISRQDIRQAYDKAIQDYFADRQMQIVADQKAMLKQRTKILLLGHPYLVHDSFVNMSIMDKVRAYDAEITTLESYDHRLLRKQAKALRKPLFWSYGSDVLGLAYHLIEEGGVDGIIYLTSFGCGIDSFTNFMVERRIRSHSAIPYTVITLDEHSAEAGINTRLEAFMDTIKWSRQDGRNISAHG